MTLFSVLFACGLLEAPEPDCRAWYLDSDLDGFGGQVKTCDPFWPGNGWAGNNGDCDDNNPDANPLATEWCDDIDNDCDGEVDRGIACTRADR